MDTKTFVLIYYPPYNGHFNILGVFSSEEKALEARKQDIENSVSFYRRPKGNSPDHYYIEETNIDHLTFSSESW